MPGASSRRSSRKTTGGNDGGHHPPGRTLLRRRGRRHRHAQAADAPTRWRRSMPAWTSTPCWCSTTRRSTTPSSSPSPRAWATIEHAIGTSLRAANEARLPTTFADVSNLDKNNTPFARDDRRRLFAIGNRLWHSDSSFKVTPAKYSLLHARQHPVEGRQHAVRRHARRLRCARRRDQGGSRGHGVRALADVLAPDHRLHRLHRRGARALQAGAAVHGAHPSGDGPQVALSLVAMPAASSAGRCPRRAATCAT